MKQLIYGPWGPSYRNKLLDTCADYLERGEFDSFFYIVPTAALAADARERLLERVPGWLGKPVLTFDDLIELVIRNASIPTQRIDSVTQERIVHHLMLQSDKIWSGKKMREWAHYPGVVSTLLQTIAELRRAGATVQMLSEQDDENTQAIVALWSEYENWLRTSKYRTLDVEESFILAHEILETRNLEQLFPKLQCLIFDHFLDFTPLQKRILRGIQTVNEVKVYIPFLQQNRNSYPELTAAMKDLQNVMGENQNLMITILDQDGDEIVTATKPKIEQSDSDTADHIVSPVSIPLKNIEIHPLLSVEKQWLWIAKQIKRLAASGASVNDMALLVPDSKSHMPAIDRLFRLEGIPHRAVVTQELTTIPIVQDMLTLLRVVAFDWEREDVLAIAARYSLMDPHIPIAVLDRLARRLGIQRGQQIWFQRLEDYLQSKADQEGRMSESRMLLKWLDRLKRITDRIPHKGTLIEYTEGLKSVIQMLAIKKRLVQVGEPVVESFGQADSRRDSSADSVYSVHDLRRDMRAVERMEEWLEEIQQIERKLGNEQAVYTAEEFLDLVTGDWNESEVTIQDASDFGVWILEPSAARGLTFAHVFFANLNEGSFPKSMPVQWLLGDDERRELHKNGIPVAMRQLQLELQKAFFAMALTLSTDSLYLLYTEESGSLRSRFIDTLIRDYPTLRDSIKHNSERDPYLQGSAMIPDDPSQISNQWELDIWNAYQLAGSASLYGWNISGSSQQLAVPGTERFNYVVEASQIEHARTLPVFGIYEGMLSDDHIRRELHSQFSRERIYSASFFNQYGECPFKFFLARVLYVELQENEGDQLAPIDRGNLYHAVLFRLFAEWQERQDKKLHEGEFDKWLNDMERIFAEEVSRFEEKTFIQSNVTWSVEKQHIWNHLQEWLIYDLKSLTSMEANLKPHRLEWSFGMSLQPDVPSDPHSIEEPVQVAGLLFQGRIDRIDYAEDEGLYTIYDYKTTGSSLQGQKDVAAGIDFQLPIYLQVVNQLKPKMAIAETANGAGAMYYGIEKLNRSKGLLHGSYKDRIGLKRQSHIKAEEWDELMQKSESLLAHYHSAIQQGQFPLQPRRCSDSCPYKTVCRYDDILALNKEPLSNQEGGNQHE
jgi:ATP-dependent helicase/nuclease subunit B